MQKQGEIFSNFLDNFKINGNKVNMLQFKYCCYELEYQDLYYNFDFILKFEKEKFFEASYGYNSVRGRRRMKRMKRKHCVRLHHFESKISSSID